MSEKKSNHAKEKMKNNKSAKCWWGNAAKVAGKIHQNVNNSAESRCQRTHTEPPGGLE